MTLQKSRVESLYGNLVTGAAERSRTRASGIEGDAIFKGEHWGDSAAAKEASSAAMDIHDLPTIMIGAIRERWIS